MEINYKQYHVAQVCSMPISNVVFIKHYEVIFRIIVRTIYRTSMPAVTMPYTTPYHLPIAYSGDLQWRSGINYLWQ